MRKKNNGDEQIPVKRCRKSKQTGILVKPDALTPCEFASLRRKSHISRRWNPWGISKIRCSKTSLQQVLSTGLHCGYESLVWLAPRSGNCGTELQRKHVVARPVQPN